MKKTYRQKYFDPGANATAPSFFRRHSVVDMLYVVYGGIILLTVCVSYLVGAFDWLQYAPDDMNLELMMAPPGTDGHLLGTDFMGRDLMSRLIIAIQAYFVPGLFAVLIALVLGTLLGVVSGYYGGRIALVFTYLQNMIDSVPKLILILLVVAAFKPDIYYIMAVVGVTSAPLVAALIQNKIFLLKKKSFIECSVALGLHPRVIIFKHILWSNCRTILIIQATLVMAEAIMLEASLSYLGFGVQEPTPSWGNMVQAGANYLMQGNLWSSTAPALAILLTVLGFHLLGDGLNNILEGKRT